MTVDYKKFDSALKRLANDQKENKITEEMILALHDVVIKEYGGEYGIRDNGLFSSICATPYQNVFGQELYPTIFDKAAKLLMDFSYYQVFVDGNKRTGVLAMAQELLINGFDCNIPDEEIYILTMDIANKNITEVKDVAEKIKPFCCFTEYEDLGQEEENIKE